ncbi:MAG: phosphonate ABC transporter ATP-binding protein [Planctomycetes bacterium]|nr:phosphonate ABC transporter ATP-binding protein [Planctomycetota bacterium]
MSSAAGFRLARASVWFAGRAALAGVDLEVRPGESLALVGPSGSGKTTLLRLLNAAVLPSSGEVSIDGRSLAQASPGELRELRAHVGFVHQDLCLVPNVRVLANVLAGRLGQQGLAASLRSQLFPPREEIERAAAILERVGILEKLYQRTDSLSGGQRQRVALARALYQEPRALLADEPVSAVDPARARNLVELLAEVSRERGLTLVVSLHDIALAREFFPRLVGLRAGAVVFDKATGEVGQAEIERLYSLEGLELDDDGRDGTA